MVTVPVWTKDLDGFSIHFSTPAGGTLVGTLTLEASNDRGNDEQTGRPDATMLNWVPIFFKDAAAVSALVGTKGVASGANQLLLEEPTCLYRWIRLRFTFTSGTANARIAMQQKGWP